MYAVIPPEFHPFVGVVGLAILFLMIVSVIHRYREWQAEKMTRAGRLMAGAAVLEQATQHLGEIGIPQELGDFCREELLVRYRDVAVLFPNMEGLQERIGQAESLRLGQGPWEIPAISSKTQLKTYHQGLSGLLDMLSNCEAKSLQNNDSTKALRNKIRTLRAESMYSFLEKSSLEAAANGEWSRAQDEVLRLISFLKSKAPANEQGKRLYQQSAQLYHYYIHQELPPEQAGAGHA